MRIFTAATLLLLATLLLPAAVVPAAGQENELAILGGGIFPVTPGEIEVDTSLALQANYSHRIARVPLLSLYFEVPVTAGFAGNVVRQPLSQVPSSYSSLFITPGLKLKIAPISPVAPYVVAGGGYARFRESQVLADGSANPDSGVTNTGVFQFGGGLDFRLAPFLGARAEVRDFYSGTPRLTFEGLRERQHTLLVAGGLVLRF